MKTSAYWILYTLIGSVNKLGLAAIIESPTNQTTCSGTPALFRCVTSEVAHILWEVNNMDPGFYGVNAPSTILENQGYVSTLSLPGDLLKLSGASVVCRYDQTYSVPVFLTVIGPLSPPEPTSNQLNSTSTLISWVSSPSSIYQVMIRNRTGLPVYNETLSRTQLVFSFPDPCDQYDVFVTAIYPNLTCIQPQNGSLQLAGGTCEITGITINATTVMTASPMIQTGDDVPAIVGAVVSILIIGIIIGVIIGGCFCFQKYQCSCKDLNTSTPMDQVAHNADHLDGDDVGRMQASYTCTTSMNISDQVQEKTPLLEEPARGNDEPLSNVDANHTDMQAPVSTRTDHTDCNQVRQMSDESALLEASAQKNVGRVDTCTLLESAIGVNRKDMSDKTALSETPAQGSDELFSSVDDVNHTDMDSPDYDAATSNAALSESVETVQAPDAGSKFNEKDEGSCARVEKKACGLSNSRPPAKIEHDTIDSSNSLVKINCPEAPAKNTDTLINESKGTPLQNNTKPSTPASHSLSSNGIRHYRNCRFFDSSKPCNPDEGRPCCYCSGGDIPPQPLFDSNP